MTDLFQNKYRIESRRAQWWDYGADAAYFITICTHERKRYFGEIIGDKIQLSDIGQIAYRFWDEIPRHFPFIILDEFVVMPNHVHGILIINKNDGNPDVDARHCLVSCLVSNKQTKETGQCPISTEDKNVIITRRKMILKPRKKYPFINCFKKYTLSLYKI